MSGVGMLEASHTVEIDAPLERVYEVAADVPGAVSVDPAEPVIVTVYVVVLALVLVGLRRGERTASADRVSGDGARRQPSGHRGSVVIWFSSSVNWGSSTPAGCRR